MKRKKTKTKREWTKAPGSESAARICPRKVPRLNPPPRLAALEVAGACLQVATSHPQHQERPKFLSSEEKKTVCWREAACWGSQSPSEARVAFYPDPPILAFFCYPRFFRFAIFLAFFVRFSSLFQGFLRVRQRKKSLFFSDDPCFFLPKKNKDWRVRAGEAPEQFKSRYV